MRVANIENNSLNWVSISSAGALDMTNCDFSERPAREEMGHIIGSSELDVIIGSILGIRAVPWSPDGSDNAFDIQVGMERPAEMVTPTPRRGADGKQGREDLPSHCRLRAVGSQRGLSRVSVSVKAC